MNNTRTLPKDSVAVLRSVQLPPPPTSGLCSVSLSFQPVLHDWCNKGHSIYYPVCGMVHIKDPLLLIKRSSPCSGGSKFLLSLYEWSFTICPTIYHGIKMCLVCRSIKHFLRSCSVSHFSSTLVCGRKEMCLFNDTLNTFYLHLHGFGNIVKNYLDTFK